MSKQSNFAVVEERESTRIRAFLISVRPLVDEPPPAWLKGKHLVQCLAQARESGDEGYFWMNFQCAEVVRFLHLSAPEKEWCYCDDRSRMNATAGYHAVLIFLAEQLERMAEPTPERSSGKRKRPVRQAAKVSGIGPLRSWRRGADLALDLVANAEESRTDDLHALNPAVREGAPQKQLVLPTLDKLAALNDRAAREGFSAVLTEYFFDAASTGCPPDLDVLEDEVEKEHAEMVATRSSNSEIKP